MFRSKFTHNEETNEVTSELTIFSLQVEDFGQYTCGAVNTVGQNDASIDVNSKCYGFY